MPGAKFRFLHAADLHLDAPFATLARAAPEIAGRLRDASLEAFDALVKVAIEREAAFVIFAGDIYDSSDRGVRAQLRFLRGVERLGEKGILVFVAHGNHDPTDGWSAIRRTPDNLVVFGSEAVEAHTFGLKNEPWAHLYGISYPRRDVMENLALRFERGTAPGLHIGILHCNVGNQPDHAAYSPCTINELTAAGMDYWALGHVHQYQRLLEGRPWVVYPGSLQAVKSSEVGPRGAVMVEVSGESVVHVEFLPLDRVRFARVVIDVASETDLASLQKTILRLAPSASVNQVLTVTLAGRGALHADLRRPRTLADLLRETRDELGIGSPFIWLDRIVDETRPELDRSAIARRGDFSADLVRLVDSLRANPAELAHSLQTLWKAAAQFEPDEPEALLRAAEERALDLLQGERQP
jgi:DNA repair protein SbcD/Mre11